MNGYTAPPMLGWTEFFTRQLFHPLVQAEFLRDLDPGGSGNPVELIFQFSRGSPFEDPAMETFSVAEIRGFVYGGRVRSDR